MLHITDQLAEEIVQRILKTTPIGSEWFHYKDPEGKTRYKVLDIVVNEFDGSAMIVYQSSYGKIKWARLYEKNPEIPEHTTREAWADIVEYGEYKGPRFRKAN